MTVKEYDVESPISHGKKTNNWSFLRILLTILNAVYHVLVLLETVYLLYYARDLSMVTNQHVVLCTLGSVLLLSEAIVVLTDENIWSVYLTRRSKSHVHWMLQVIGAILSIVGVAIVYYRKKTHFKSLHAKFGFASVVGVIILAFSGVPTLFAALLREKIRPVIIKFIHNLLGILCFVMGMAAVIESYKKTKYFGNMQTEVFTTCIVVSYIVLIFSLLGALRSLLNQTIGLFQCS